MLAIARNNSQTTIRGVTTSLLVSIALVTMSLVSPTSRAAEENAQQPRPDVAGNWLGTLDVGAIKLRVGLTVSRSVEGMLSATFFSIDQGNVPLSVDALNEAEGELSFDINRVKGNYRGKIDVAAEQIDGTWSQSGLELPLVLKKVDRLPDIKRPQDPKKPYPYTAEEVVFPNDQDEISLAGTFTKPKGTGRFPAAILISGSGPQNRDEELLGHRPFLVLADHLTRQGVQVPSRVVAVLRLRIAGYGLPVTSEHPPRWRKPAVTADGTCTSM